MRRNTKRPPTPPASNALVEVHARLFADSVEEIKKIADERGVPWQIELRLLVRRALRSERREVVVIKEQP